MSSAILTVLDYLDKSISELGRAILKGDLKLIRVRYETLLDFSQCLQSLLPKDFVETAFRDFNSHMSYLQYYIRKGSFDYIESNFSDLANLDFPELKLEVYGLLDKMKLPEKQHATSKDIFIVHGKDHESVRELKRMLQEFGLNPIVLHEQPSASRTIVEKLEHYSENVGFAFVLLTQDDALVPTVQMVQVDKKQGTTRPFYLYNAPPVLRARQNVILEFGYFIAKIGRRNVCCLYKENTELPYEMPSDMHGIVYISFKESVTEIQDKIAKELKDAGYQIKSTNVR